MANKPSESLKVFTNNLFDYEGLLPPENLSLSDALNYYMRYRKEDYSWMLSSLVCPAKLLPELWKLIKNKYADEKEIKINVLGEGGDTEKEFVSTLTDNVKMWKEFVKSNETTVITDAFDVRLPTEVVQSHNSKVLSSLVFLISELITDNIPGSIMIFLEGQLGNNWKKSVKVVIEAIKTHNLSFSNTSYKLRAGGDESPGFLEPTQITYVIRECLKREIEMKVTGGLQNPLTQIDESTKSEKPGFLNVFGAGVIAMRHNISDHGLIEVLKDKDINNFTFTDENFLWKNWEINLKDINYARKYLMISCGSSNFDNNVKSLKTIGLL
jgi:hypothetical protein